MQRVLDKRTADIHRHVQTEQKQLQALIEQGKQTIQKQASQNKQVETQITHSYEQALSQLETLYEEIEQAQVALHKIQDEQTSVTSGHSARKEAAMQSLLQFLDENPNASMDEAGVAIGRAKSTVHNYIRELQENQRLTKNGHGWEVAPS